MSVFDTEKFKKLQGEWYTILEASGFKNIEDSEQRLTDHKSILDLKDRIHFKTGYRELHISYYVWACEMLYSGEFKCERDKLIWEYHSEGFTGSEISEKIGLERTWINRVIQKTRKYLK